MEHQNKLDVQLVRGAGCGIVTFRPRQRVPVKVLLLLPSRDAEETITCWLPPAAQTSSAKVDASYTAAAQATRWARCPYAADVSDPSAPDPISATADKALRIHLRCFAIHRADPSGASGGRRL